MPSRVRPVPRTVGFRPRRGCQDRVPSGWRRVNASSLIEPFLKQGVLEGLREWTPDESHAYFAAHRLYNLEAARVARRLAK